MDLPWEPGGSPEQPKAVVTGVLATKTDAATDAEWSVEELKAGKPLLVYYFVEGLQPTTEDRSDSYKFSLSFEMGGLGSKVVDEIKESWRARKVGLDIEADRKVEKNQARIEFWSFTGVKMGTVTTKERSSLNPGPLRNLLKKYADKNTQLCAKEIKRIEAQQKAEAKADSEGETALAK